MSSRSPDPPRGDATHLQLQHFLLLELHPGLSLSGLTGLLLGLQLLLLPGLLPQPRYPGRNKRPRLSGLGSRGPDRGPRPAPPRPPVSPQLVQPLVLRPIPGHQLAVLSGVLQRLALRQDPGPRLVHLPPHLGHELQPGRDAPKVGTLSPPAPTLPAAASLSTVSHT